MVVHGSPLSYFIFVIGPVDAVDNCRLACSGPGKARAQGVDVGTGVCGCLWVDVLAGGCIPRLTVSYPQERCPESGGRWFCPQVMQVRG